MAWNRSENGEAVSRPLQKRSGDRFPVRGAIAGVIVVVGAAVAAWWLWPEGKSAGETPPPQSSQRIADIKPSIPSNRVEVADEHKGMVLVRGKWYPEYNEKGGRIWVTQNRVRYHTPVVVKTSAREAGIRPERKIFDNWADQEIAILLNIPVGTSIIGSVRYDERFTKKFLESIKTPIIVRQDDPEDIKALKRAVNETKAELKARHDAGEDIAKIMTDSRKELQQLGAYRDELRREVQKLLRTEGVRGNSQAIQDLYDSANKMLGDRNLPKLAFPTALLNNLKLHNK